QKGLIVHSFVHTRTWRQAFNDKIIDLSRGFPGRRPIRRLLRARKIGQRHEKKQRDRQPQTQPELPFAAHGRKPRRRLVETRFAETYGGWITGNIKEARGRCQVSIASIEMTLEIR